MTELAKEHLVNLELIIKEYFDDFTVMTIDFKDGCGCYSDYTTDPCRLEIEVSAYLPYSERDMYQKRNELQGAIGRWAKRNLDFEGCESCEDDLIIDVCLVPKGKKHE